MGTASIERVTLENGWSFNVSKEHVSISTDAATKGRDIVTAWAQQFRPNGTWVGDTLGVPSLFVRIDGIFRDGVWHIFEIEDRPCGMGAIQLFNSKFAERLGAVRKSWPEFHFVKSATRVTDDELWLGAPLSLEESLLRSDKVLVRARPEEAEYHPLRVRSVSTVIEEGNKQSLIDMGMAALVMWEDSLGTPPHDGYIEPTLPAHPIVLKPLQGTRGRDIYFHGVDPVLKHAVSKRRGDTRGIEGIERVLKRHKKMVMQPFVCPLELPHLPGMNTIYRLYYGYDVNAREYVPLHGAYAASTSLKVHGDTDTVFGPLVVS